MLALAIGLCFLLSAAAATGPIESDELMKFGFVDGSEELSGLSGVTSQELLDCKAKQPTDSSSKRALKGISLCTCDIANARGAFQVSTDVGLMRTRLDGGSEGNYIDQFDLGYEDKCDKPISYGYQRAEVGQLYYITALRFCDSGGSKTEREFGGLRIWGQPLVEPDILPALAESTSKTDKAKAIPSNILDGAALLSSWLGPDTVKAEYVDDNCKKWRKKVECPSGKVGIGVRVHYGHSFSNNGARVTGMTLWCATPKKW